MSTNIQSLDKTEDEISTHVGALRSLASQYAKKCNSLGKLRLQHQTEIKEMKTILELCVKESKKTKEKGLDTKQEEQMVQELATTFKKWSIRSIKRHNNQNNTIQSSYRRVKDSVNQILHLDNNESDSSNNVENYSRSINLTPNSPSRNKRSNSTTINTTATTSSTNTATTDSSAKSNKDDTTKSTKSNSIKSKTNTDNLIALHRAEEEARQWRRTSDKLQLELSKLRQMNQELEHSNDASNNKMLTTQKEATEEWQNKCKELQINNFELTKQLRNQEHDRKMNTHQTARCQSLEKEVLKLRKSLTTHLTEFQKLDLQNTTTKEKKEKEIQLQNLSLKQKEEALHASYTQKEEDMRLQREEEKRIWEENQRQAEIEVTALVQKEKENNRFIQLQNQENDEIQNKYKETIQEKEKLIQELQQHQIEFSRSTENQILLKETELLQLQNTVQQQVQQIHSIQYQTASQLYRSTNGKILRHILFTWQKKTRRIKKIKRKLTWILYPEENASHSNHVDVDDVDDVDNGNYQWLLKHKKRRRFILRNGLKRWIFVIHRLRAIAMKKRAISFMCMHNVRYRHRNCMAHCYSQWLQYTSRSVAHSKRLRHVLLRTVKAWRKAHLRCGFVRWSTTVQVFKMKYKKKQEIQRMIRCGANKRKRSVLGLWKQHASRFNAIRRVIQMTTRTNQDLLKKCFGCWITKCLVRGRSICEKEREITYRGRRQRTRATYQLLQRSITMWYKHISTTKTMRYLLGRVINGKKKLNVGFAFVRWKNQHCLYDEKRKRLLKLCIVHWKTKPLKQALHLWQNKMLYVHKHVLDKQSKKLQNLSFHFKNNLLKFTTKSILTSTFSSWKRVWRMVRERKVHLNQLCILLNGWSATSVLQLHYMFQLSFYKWRIQTVTKSLHKELTHKKMKMKNQSTKINYKIKNEETNLKLKNVNQQLEQLENELYNEKKLHGTTKNVVIEQENQIKTIQRHVTNKDRELTMMMEENKIEQIRTSANESAFENEMNKIIEERDVLSASLRMEKEKDIAQVQQLKAAVLEKEVEKRKRIVMEKDFIQMENKLHNMSMELKSEAKKFEAMETTGAILITEKEDFIFSLAALRKKYTEKNQLMKQLEMKMQRCVTKEEKRMEQIDLLNQEILAFQKDKETFLLQIEEYKSETDVLRSKNNKQNQELKNTVQKYENVISNIQHQSDHVGTEEKDLLIQFNAIKEKYINEKYQKEQGALELKKIQKEQNRVISEYKEKENESQEEIAALTLNVQDLLQEIQEKSELMENKNMKKRRERELETKNKNHELRVLRKKISILNIELEDVVDNSDMLRKQLLDREEILSELEKENERKRMKQKEMKRKQQNNDVLQTQEEIELQMEVARNDMKAMYSNQIVSYEKEIATLQKQVQALLEDKEKEKQKGKVMKPLPPPMPPSNGSIHNVGRLALLQINQKETHSINADVSVVSASASSVSSASSSSSSDEDADEDGTGSVEEVTKEVLPLAPFTPSTAPQEYDPSLHSLRPSLSKASSKDNTNGRKSQSSAINETSLSLHGVGSRNNSRIQNTSKQFTLLEEERRQATETVIELKKVLKNKTRQISRLLRERESRRLHTMQIETALKNSVNGSAILKKDLNITLKEKIRLDSIRSSLLSSLRSEQTKAAVSITETGELQSQCHVLATKLKACSMHLKTVLNDNNDLKNALLDINDEKNVLVKEYGMLEKENEKVLIELSKVRSFQFVALKEGTIARNMLKNLEMEGGDVDVE